VTERRIVEGGLEEPAELEPEQGTLALAAPEDAAHTREEWEAAAAAVLRKQRRLAEDAPDALVWDKLTRTTLDGVGITPLGIAEQLEDLRTVGRPSRAGDWDIRAHLSARDPKVANEAARDDLENGATSLWLELGPDVDLAVLLDGMLLDVAPVVLDASDDPVGVAQAFLGLAAGTTLHPASNLGVSAAGVSTGSNSGTQVADMAREAGVLGFVVDASDLHDRGASDAQELAYALAVAATYLRTLTDSGIDLDEAVRLVEFRYAATDEQFLTIAKLRAARRLWARVLELSGGAPAEQRQHAVTSRPMMSKYDPWVNMLRTTVAAFAAGVGDANAVTVLPFDSPLGVPDAFGRRIARNTSSLLMAESHVARVTDPAGGAYAVERLTDDLAAAAWELFGRLEQGASLDEMIAATVELRKAQVATRSHPITGLSEFPNLHEALPERQPDEVAHAVRRWGASFEELRDDPPEGQVFLATMGTVAAHTARATFVGNLFAAGGIAVDLAGATDGADDLVAKYDGQAVVCLAGTDAAYAEWADVAVARLREAGAQWVIVAGRPRDDADDSCAVGVDALAFLRRTREKLA
jgi:methylmalonyl-CoA mutase